MIGFLSFIPTNYIGLSELGIISSFGIIIGLLTNMILLPSLLIFFKIKHNHKPRNEMSNIYAQTVNYMSKYHKIYFFVVPLILFLAYISTKDVHFDSDPIKLKDQKAQSVITALELMEKNPSSDYTISVFQREFDKKKISLLKEKKIKKKDFKKKKQKKKKKKKTKKTKKKKKNKTQKKKKKKKQKNKKNYELIKFLYLLLDMAYL